jgi:formylglycine-generating enzyme required for sulfatase activity
MTVNATGFVESRSPFGIPENRLMDTRTQDAETSGPQARRIPIPDIAWIEIPAGPFIYQDGERRELPNFWIAKYPITNIQFQTFIDDGGYGEERWWQDLKKPEPQAPRWEQPNRPRTSVDWYEAVAFTRWLSTRLGLAEETVRLPTELEWEKAARGEKGFACPWGSKYRTGYANINEKSGEDGPWYLEQTTAVGMYPHGRSPYGVEDLSGTVWEWCLTKFDEPDATAVYPSAAPRGLRGGSWLGGSDRARAGVRNGLRPGVRDDYRGFRVLSSVPIAVR